MDFLSDRADATFPGLFFIQFGLESCFELFELISAGLSPADIEPKEPSISLKDIGLEHLVEEIGVFGIKVCSFDGVEDGGLFIDLFIFD